MTASHSHSPTHSPRSMALLGVMVGALVAGVLGLLTFGVQATVHPDDVPLAIAVPADGPAAAPLRAAAQQIASQGEGQVAWQITTPEQAMTLLEDKSVYGVLELVAAPAARLTATVTLSGAVNPSGTQVAQQALTGAAEAATAAAARSAAPTAEPPVAVRTVHEATAAGRTAPLAASALLWIGTLVAGLLVSIPALRGVAVRPATRLVVASGSAVTVTATVWALLALWDADLVTSLRFPAFLLLVAVAFASLQAATFRLIGVRGMAILAPFYLMAPSVASQVPELLHPAYRALLWSWTPFRFSTEGLRSLFQLDEVPPDVWTAVWVFAVMAVAALVVLLWPSRRQPEEIPAHGDAAAPALRT